jgi:hypothetical protein
VAWLESLSLELLSLELDTLGELLEELLLDDELLSELDELVESVDEVVDEVELDEVEVCVLAEAAAAMPAVPMTLTAARPPVTNMTRRRPRSRPGS